MDTAGVYERAQGDSIKGAKNTILTNEARIQVPGDEKAFRK